MNKAEDEREKFLNILAWIIGEYFASYENINCEITFNLNKKYNFDITTSTFKEVKYGKRN